MYKLLVAQIVIAMGGVDALECKFGVLRDGEAEFSEHLGDDNNESFPFLSSPLVDEQYCDCDPGYSGVRCDTPFVSCNDEKQFKCYYGGNCTKSRMGGVETDRCDCRHARTPDGLYTVGLHCQISWKGKHINTCDENEGTFCVNNSPCNQGKNKDVIPCSCREGFTGKHCEFRVITMGTTCNLGCLNGGQCHFGLRNVTSHEVVTNGRSYDPNDVDKFQYCQCKEGFSGRLCDVQHETCDGKTCYHGSACREYVDPKLGLQRACDCSVADFQNRSYAGEQCEFSANTHCLKDGGTDGYAFCTNGGECHNINGIWQCDCPTGFTGEWCERVSKNSTNSSPAMTTACSTQCQNGGECRNGFKNYGALSEFDELESITTTKTTPLGFEHCVCRDGWGGLYCEAKVEACGDDHDHICLHGNQCVRKEGGRFECDCVGGTAGDFCQHKATSSCADGSHFCTNNGTCNDDRTCSCSGGWIGDHCEISLSAAESYYYDDDGDGDDDVDNNNNNNNNDSVANRTDRTMVLAVTGFVFGTFCIAAAVVITLMNSTKRLQIERVALEDYARDDPLRDDTVGIMEKDIIM